MSPVSCSDSLGPTRAKKGFELQMQVCLDLISVWGGSQTAAATHRMFRRRGHVWCRGTVKPKPSEYTWTQPRGTFKTSTAFLTAGTVLSRRRLSLTTDKPWSHNPPSQKVHNWLKTWLTMKGFRPGFWFQCEQDSSSALSSKEVGWGWRGET